MNKAIIQGTGHYVPKNVITNFDLEKLMDTSDEWIRERSGIVERRFVDPGESTSDLAYKASLIAIEDADISKEEIDFIIFATLSPDHLFPGAGVFLQEKLGLTGIGVLDVRNQCTGFIYALSVADQYVKTGMYKKILVIGAEVQSVHLNMSTEGRDMAVLFGDGAGAVIVSKNERDDGKGIIATHLHADGRFADILWMEKPRITDKPYFSLELIQDKRRFPTMQGKMVFKLASEKMPECMKEILEENNLSVNDLDFLIPHQANYRITEMVGKILGISPEKVVSNIHKYGNTTAASIPIAFDEIKKEGKIKDGSLIGLTAFGSGLTWGSALIRM
ncbi:MAG: beta-ketoacyl-ACP synthase III [Acidobacteriota bacterium]